MRWRRNRIVSAMARMYRVRIIFRFVSKAATGRQQARPVLSAGRPLLSQRALPGRHVPFFSPASARKTRLLQVLPALPPTSGRPQRFQRGDAVSDIPKPARPHKGSAYFVPRVTPPKSGCRLLVHRSPAQKKQRAGMSRTYAHRYTLFINIAQGNQKKQDSSLKKI